MSVRLLLVVALCSCWPVVTRGVAAEFLEDAQRLIDDEALFAGCRRRLLADDSEFSLDDPCLAGPRARIEGLLLARRRSALEEWVRRSAAGEPTSVLDTEVGLWPVEVPSPGEDAREEGSDFDRLGKAIVALSEGRLQDDDLRWDGEALEVAWGLVLARYLMRTPDCESLAKDSDLCSRVGERASALLKAESDFAGLDAGTGEDWSRSVTQSNVFFVADPVMDRPWPPLVTSPRFGDARWIERALRRHRDRVLSEFRSLEALFEEEPSFSSEPVDRRDRKGSKVTILVVPDPPMAAAPRGGWSAR